MKKYTVIGYWPDTMQRFAASVEAVNPEDAEAATLHKHHGLAVCGVVEGQHQCVDSCELVHISGL